MPDASVRLFSVKAAAQNGYSTTLKEKEIVIRRGEGTIAASGRLINNHYLLAIQVCNPQNAAEIHRERKQKHCKDGMGVLVIKMIAML